MKTWAIHTIAPSDGVACRPCCASRICRFAVLSRPASTLRQRMMHDRKGPLMVRLQVLVDPGVGVKMKHIAKRTGWTQREIVEAAVKLLDERTVGRK